MIDFIIVGAAKSGTESLVFHLNNHKKICTPKKEIGFFNNVKEYEKGINYYEKKIHQYCCNNNKLKKIIGEKTPAYCYEPNTPKRIYSYNPNIKLIWIFRNPVNRTYSNYWHYVKKGIETLNFEDTIEKESMRIKENFYLGYVKRSIYIEQVTRYMKYFSKEQMCYLIFENLIENPEKELSKAFEFLGVNKKEYSYLDEVKNKTALPRFPIINQYIANKFGNFSFLNRITYKLNSLFTPPGYPKMSQQTRTKLTEYFKPYNESLQNVIDRDLSIWN